MPEIIYHYPNDATGSSSSGEEATWPTAGYQPRRRGYRPQIPETQQAADEFTTSSSENSLEEYQISGTPRLRRTRSSVRAEEDLQQDDESIAIDSDLPNEVNLLVVTDTASMSSEEDVTWTRRHEQSGSDADSERSNTPETLAIADLNESRQNTQITETSRARKILSDYFFYTIYITQRIVLLLSRYKKPAGLDRFHYNRFDTEYQNFGGKCFVRQHERVW